MATYDEVMTALRNADKAGAEDDARALAQIARRMRSAAVPVDQKIDSPSAQLDRINQVQPASPEKKTDFLDKARGAIETVGGVVAGVPASALGLVGGTLGGIAGSIASGEFGTPKGARLASEVASESAHRLGAPFQPKSQAGAEYMDRFGRMIESTMAPPWPVMSLIPGVGAAARGTRALAGKVAGYEPRPLTGIPPEAVSSAIKDGFRVPPSMGGAGMVGKAAEGLSGKIQTAQRLSLFNSENINKLAREDLGIPADARISEKVLQKIRAKEGEAYQAIKELDDPIVPNEEYLNKVGALGGDYKAAMEEFPALMENKQIDTLIASMSAPQEISGRAGIEVVKKLRSDATANLKAFDDPQKRALGLAQRQAAQAMDELIESHLQSTPGKEKLGGRYRRAREKIAMTYDVEAALNDATGNVSLRVLGKLGEKRPLSGGLKKGADFYNSFEKAGQDVEKIGSQPGFSPLDFAVGAIPAALSGQWGAAALMAGRPATRAVLTSRPYQNMLGRQADKRLAAMVKSTDAPPAIAPAPLPEVPGAVPIIPGTLSSLIRSAEPDIPMPQLPEALQGKLERMMRVPGSSLSIAGEQPPASLSRPAPASPAAFGARQEYGKAVPATPSRTPLPAIPPQESGLLSTVGAPLAGKEAQAMSAVEMKLRPEVMVRVKELRSIYSDVYNYPTSVRLKAAKELAELKDTYPGFVMDMIDADSTLKMLYESVGEGTMLPIEKVRAYNKPGPKPKAPPPPDQEK